uniref:SJCHGC05199 protein n=1 Tax=Schistosoma japonicum TaxID=6182 RepID=Q5BSB2_SCHJA|nr:SJCHGC05199 protein [Schistosoma japonicum]
MFHAFSMKIKLQIKNNKAGNLIFPQLPKMKEFQFYTDDNPFFDVNDAYFWGKDEESKGIVMGAIMGPLEGCI